MMTRAQAAWAASHDWHVATFETAAGFAVLVREESTQYGRPLPVAYLVFTDAHKLRDYAGY